MPVFISYRHTDRISAIEIDKRLRNAQIVTYLDVLDEASINATEEITNIITDRMSQCTHLIAIISDDTSKSWWVPFEIGEATYAQNRIATYQLGISDDKLPSYLMKWPKMKNLTHLDDFIKFYKKDVKESVATESAFGNELYKAVGVTTTADEFHRVLKRSLGQ